VLSEWADAAPPSDAFTTVMSWTSYQPLRYRGVTYGQKDVELRRFLDLPTRVRPVPLEIALSGTRHVEWETGDLGPLPPAAGEAVPRRGCTASDLLRAAGWRVVDAATACGDLDSYRRYVCASRGEWSVAKGGYVRGQAGWFSCRSACYLAAGRPVIVQDTGFGGVLPTGTGIVSFATIDEATAAIREVHGNYARHAAAARAIAAEYFDAAHVLTHLLDEALRADP
jgi:hypothetical protein